MARSIAHSSHGRGPFLSYGVAAVQGWREEMEDAWAVHPQMELGTLHAGYFGVFDGHGGSCVSDYLKLRLHERISKEAAGTEGTSVDLTALLSRAFVALDKSLLLDPDAARELEELCYSRFGMEASAKYRGLDGRRRRELVRAKIMRRARELSPLSPAQLALIEAELVAVNEGRPSDDAIETGSTAVVMLVSDVTQRDCFRLTVANLGDSRAILSEGDVVTPLSRDHSPTDAGEHERIVAAGATVNRFGRICPLGLNLSRAFGDHACKNTDLAPHEQAVSAVPEVTSVEINGSARSGGHSFVVLASDGVWNMLDNEEAAQLVLHSLSPSPTAEHLAEVATKLCMACIAPSPDHVNGTDNVTALIVYFD
jgi:serine/threonine protein phosphatase PrpC